MNHIWLLICQRIEHSIFGYENNYLDKIYPDSVIWVFNIKHENMGDKMVSRSTMPVSEGKFSMPDGSEKQQQDYRNI